MALYLNSLTSIGAKIESTAYTAESLSASDYNFRAYEISYSVEIEEFKRQYATGDWDSFASSMGTQKGSVTFSVDMAPGATNLANPNWAKLLLGCSFTSATNGTSGINYTKDSRYGNVPLTMEVQEVEEGVSPQALVIKLKGCTGNVTGEVAKVGGMVKLTFTFEGVLVSITDRTAENVITPAGFDTTSAERVLSVTASVYGETCDFGSAKFDVGNKLAMEEDPSAATGLKGSHVVASNSTIEIDPFLHRISDRALYARYTAGTTGAFSLATSNFRITAPAVQVVKAFGSADRNGFRSNNISLICNRSSGNDSFKIYQGV